MTPYFADQGNQQALINALHEREGRPFAEGIFDCIELVRQCYAAAGVDVSILDGMPRVSLNYGRFHKDSAILRFLLETQELRTRLKRLDEDEPPMCGDLLGVKQYQCVHHLALAEDENWMWHVPRRAAVFRQVLSLYPITVKFRLMI